MRDKEDGKMFEDLVVVRSGGDLGTAIAHKLFNSGFKVAITEIEKPLVVRRTVSFAQAIFQGSITVENIKGLKVSNYKDIENTLKEGCIPVIIDPYLNILKECNIDILIDATLRKKNVDMNVNMAPFTIGVGPGFYASKDVHIVIETKRGHNLGRIIYEGEAEKNTGIPGAIMSYTIERVLRSPAFGIVKSKLNIGDYVKKGDVIGSVAGIDFKAEIDGVLRGLIMNGVYVQKGLKIGDIDPRENREYCYSISDKGRAIAGGVLEAILWRKSFLRRSNVWS
ncbi:selenium-dependent molybdenum cofactor biosynthesis protein YqeB [Clostridium lundense]|uniref:selenium-dependent molybdenum cofactor biosynthesis protein YqeB n=1 Tax=Clostridium lundense TaxID=319475 RepID=UPI001FA7BEBC|nr:selenium-dependent molybdenum cofactor biosynthesis protein YqeB [Clostridium lundense]